MNKADFTDFKTAQKKDAGKGKAQVKYVYGKKVVLWEGC